MVRSLVRNSFHQPSLSVIPEIVFFIFLIFSIIPLIIEITLFHRFPGNRIILLSISQIRVIKPDFEADLIFSSCFSSDGFPVCGSAVLFSNSTASVFGAWSWKFSAACASGWDAFFSVSMRDSAICLVFSSATALLTFDSSPEASFTSGFFVLFSWDIPFVCADFFFLFFALLLEVWLTEFFLLPPFSFLSQPFIVSNETPKNRITSFPSPLWKQNLTPMTWNSQVILASSSVSLKLPVSFTALAW